MPTELELWTGLAALILTFAWAMLNWKKANVGAKEKLDPYKVGPTMALALCVVALVYWADVTPAQAEEMTQPLAPLIVLVVNTLIAMYFKEKIAAARKRKDGGAEPAPPPAPPPPEPPTEPDGGWAPLHERSAPTISDAGLVFFSKTSSAGSNGGPKESPLELIH